MQKIANEMNLVETTFVFPPNESNADFSIRYFTPQNEVAVASHPTIATIHALIEEGKIKLSVNTHQVQVETGAGVLPVDINVAEAGNYNITMTMATPKFERAPITYSELAVMLGTDSSNVDTNYHIQKMYTGIYWFVARLTSLAAIRNLRPDMAAIAEISRREKVSGIQVFTTETEDPQCNFHVRTFLPNEGINEDPVCGTGNSCIGAFIVENEIVKTNGQLTFTSEQGIELGRPGRVKIKVQGMPHAVNKIQISGTTVTVLTGEIKF
ncbi:phenazine biosynthesis PhzF family protein [Desulfosporosinus sp. OT]|nr:phenazine biosynthesis PhzF family protein [Desulfosporosinus sp. OT]